MGWNNVEMKSEMCVIKSEIKIFWNPIKFLNSEKISLADKQVSKQPY